MVKQFFVTIFSFAFVLIVFMNLVIAFNYGGLFQPGQQYFGITTLIDALDPSNYGGNGVAKSIVDYLQFVKESLPTVHQAFQSFRESDSESGGLWSALITIVFGAPVSWVTSLFGLPSFSAVVTGLSYLVEVAVTLFSYAVMLLLYASYLVTIFFEILGGSYISATPVPSWTYPTPSFLQVLFQSARIYA